MPRKVSAVDFDAIGDVLREFGFPILVAGVAAFVAWFLLKTLIDEHKAARTVWKQRETQLRADFADQIARSELLRLEQVTRAEKAESLLAAQVSATRESAETVRELVRAVQEARIDIASVRRSPARPARD